MKRNQVRIVSNAKKQSLAFYLKDEQEKWRKISNSSDLSRKKYTASSIKESAEEIVRVIGSEYNPANRGVDIYFEGAEEDFFILKNVIDKKCSQNYLDCIYVRDTKIAVAGKVGSGKTTLIKGIEDYKGVSFVHQENNGLLSYSDDELKVVWYEIPGIDIGVENIYAARNTFEQLANEGLTTFIYCLGTTKIETLEEELIRFVRNDYPSIKILIVLTRFVDDDNKIYADQLSGNLNGTKVIPVLAKEMKTRSGIIPAYGLDNVDRYIFEGRYNG